MVLKRCYDHYQFSDYFKTNLPDHWTEKRLGYLAKEERAAFVDGPFGSDLKTSDYKDDGVPLIQLNNIRDSKHLMQNMKFVTEDKKQQLIRHIAIPGDVVIAKMADPVARAAVVANDYSEYVIVADCVKFTPNLNLVDLRYLVWSINCDQVRINAELVATGTTRIRINLGELKKLKIPYPPFLEQKTIANFLDHETAKIDILIEKQQQLIKLLKEKRQAVISHAVTKGLNPNVPMRDSGVEWLGEVPEHWELVPLKYLCKFSGGGTPSKENLSYWTGGNIPWVSPKDMKSFWLSDTQDKLTEKAVEESSTNFVEIRALLMVVRSGILQRTIPIAINTVRVTLNQDMKALRFNSQMNVEYAANFILGYQDSLLLEWSKEGATVESIEHEYLSNSLFPVPPIEEQEKINESIKGQMDVFQSLEDYAVRGIALMQERRTALISAAVTGKIDVRNWQAPEPLRNPKEIHKDEAA